MAKLFIVLHSKLDRCTQHGTPDQQSRYHASLQQNQEDKAHVQ